MKTIVLLLCLDYKRFLTIVLKCVCVKNNQECAIQAQNSI